MFLRAAVLMFSAIAFAQQHPNFAGTWTLNRAESDFTDKRAVAPDSLILTVHHKGDDLSYDTVREKDGRKSKGHLDLSVGNPNPLGGEGTASAEWKADKLEFKLLNNAGQPRNSKPSTLGRSPRTEKSSPATMSCTFRTMAANPECTACSTGKTKDNQPSPSPRRSAYRAAPYGGAHKSATDTHSAY